MSTTASSNGQAVIGNEHAETLLILDDYDLLWPHQDDADHARQFELHTYHAEYPRLPHAARGHQIIVCSTDDEAGMRDAQSLARKCLGWKADKVFLWVVPEFGSKYPRLAEWSKQYDLLETIGMARPWDDSVVSVGSQGQESPDFSGVVPCPVTADLLPAPPLEDVMIPFSLRPWVLDVAKRAWVPRIYRGRGDRCSQCVGRQSFGDSAQAP